MGRGVVWSGVERASEATWVQAEEGALDWPWHATKLGGNTMPKKMRLGQHRHSPQCAYSTLRRPQLQLGRHRRVATICTQLWRKLNAIALHSSGHKREIATKRERERDGAGEREEQQKPLWATSRFEQCAVF